MSARADRGFLIMTVQGPSGEAFYSTSSPLGDLEIFKRIAKLAAKVGYELKPDGHRKTFVERRDWPLTVRGYTSFRADGKGRAGSSLYSWPARALPCHYCRGKGARGGGPMAPSCKRCSGSGLKGRAL